MVSAELRRLRAARALFERAQAENVSMAEARALIHRERHTRIVGRLQRKIATGLCGTAAPALVEQPSRPLPWYQRD